MSDESIKPRIIVFDTTQPEVPYDFSTEVGRKNIDDTLRTIMQYSPGQNNDDVIIFLRGKHSAQELFWGFNGDQDLIAEGIASIALQEPDFHKIIQAAINGVEKLGESNGQFTPEALVLADIIESLYRIIVTLRPHVTEEFVNTFHRLFNDRDDVDLRNWLRECANGMSYLKTTNE